MKIENSAGNQQC